MGVAGRGSPCHQIHSCSLKLLELLLNWVRPCLPCFPERTVSAFGHCGNGYNRPIISRLLYVWDVQASLTLRLLLTHLLVQEHFHPPGTSGPVLSQGTDAPCGGPGRNPLHGKPQSDVSWLQGPGSWPRRAGNAPNTLLPPIAKGREAPSERPFSGDSQTKSFLWGMGDGGE